MKKLKQLHDYLDSPAVNQSLLKDVISNKITADKATVYTILGGLADCLLTSPVLYEDLYFVSTAGRPTGHILEIVTALVNRLGDTVEHLDDIPDEIVQTKERLELLNNIKDKDKVLKAVLPFRDYYRECRRVKGRTVISEEERIEAEEIARIMKYSSSTSHLFNCDDPDISIEYQTPLYRKIEGVDCKGLPDIIWSHTKAKRARVVDIKVTDYKINAFLYNARRFRYDFQLSFYHEIASSIYTDYSFEFPQLAVYSKADRKSAIFELTPEDMEIGKHGATFVSGTYHTHGSETKLDKVKVVEGFLDGIHKYKYCRRHGLDNWDMEYHINKGFYNQSMWE